MRISRVKIAGFKSFVDPTTLVLPGNLSAIIGPNGGGKSNIIDAVNWVMGESSAKHLRGDSMADVIFNGSNTRKPVGQCSVELIFDNSDGSVGGQYAGYGEIAIKRQLSRDGVSAYSLNGSRCRRKDITDLFLGTGLGSRSYSVIEQGMITRIVEAKPEELRTFLEEAAGISKYKERRRETENRIRNTNDNLSRLNDIRDELEKQLAHLHRQAKAAERFKTLKDEQRRLDGELLALRWRKVHATAQDFERVLQERATSVEKAIAEQRTVEKNNIELRERQTSATDAFNQVQAEYYGVGADISRLEQGIKHGQERRETLEADLAHTLASLDDAEQKVAADEAQIDAIRNELASSEPQLGQFEAREVSAYQDLTKGEQLIQTSQDSWDAFNARAAEVSRTEDVEQTRLEHIEESIASTAGRLQKLADERDRIASSESATELRQLQYKLERANENHEKLTAEHERRVGKGRELRELIDRVVAEMDATRQQQQTHVARRASLEALQKAALGTDQQRLADWLREQQLDERPRLLQQLEIEPGWERALETVIRVPMSAISVESLAEVVDKAVTLTGGALNLVQRESLSRGGAEYAQAALLRDKVRSEWPLDALLGRVYAAEDLASALRLWERLGADESVVTRDGVWLGPGWLRINREQADSGSLLSRAEDIKSLRQSETSLSVRIDELNRRLRTARGELRALEQDDNAASILDASRERVASLRSQLAAKETEFAHLRARLAQLTEELESLDDAQVLDRDEAQTAHRRLASAREGSESLTAERLRLVEQRRSVQSELARTREHWRSVRDELHALTVHLETKRSQQKALDQSLQRYRDIIQQTRERADELRAALSVADTPIDQMRRDLEEKLEQRVEIEAKLAAARQGLEQIDTDLRDGEQQRSHHEQHVQIRRDALEEARVEARALEVRLQTVVEQLQSAGHALEEILESLSSERDEETCTADIEAVERCVVRLGPINLAAIDEYDQLAERKAYLDKQHDDLAEALATLQEAIRKIDRETRTRFKETYDKVNSGLQDKFPVLFGGGHAYLELTGEDLLETGVTVMARPPGKRNSNIHLLSGGEKALTALSLIFAIFELNPAPFCLLDEVDAPLDDTNVYRFCDLLRSMAGQVQFIFITHNKITMEIADQLVGVTMQEAGVSRFVAVDMDEAVEMAATA